MQKKNFLTVQRMFKVYYNPFNLLKFLLMSPSKPDLYFQMCYGRHDDASVEKVKALYNTLQIPTLYKQYEEESYQRLQKLIATHAQNLPHAVFLNFAKKIYKRNK